MNKFVFTLIAAVLCGTLQQSTTHAQPPFKPGEIAYAIPDPEPDYRGPAIGIRVDQYQRIHINGTTYDGVRIKQDFKGKKLYADNGSGGWKRYRFSPGNDVITHVNGSSVRSATQVLQNTFEGWNVLKIYDRNRRTYREYVIYLQ